MKTMSHSAPLHRHDQLALLIALVLIVIWGGNFTLQKYLFDLITPGGFLWARYLIMPTCALLLMRWRFGHWLPPLPRKDWMQMAWLLRYECRDLFIETLLVLRAKARAFDLGLDETDEPAEEDDGKFETSETDRGKATPAARASDEESAI